mgnify:CR=1 FL=1
MRSWVLGWLCGLIVAPLATAQSAIDFDHSDAETDRLVERCLETDGVSMLEGTDVICYNAAIFPEQFLKLNALPSASRIIITSPGGNVATARGQPPCDETSRSICGVRRPTGHRRLGYR